MALINHWVTHVFPYLDVYLTLFTAEYFSICLECAVNFVEDAYYAQRGALSAHCQDFAHKEET